MEKESGSQSSDKHLVDVGGVKRRQTCGEALAKVLKQHGCMLKVFIHLTDGRVETEIRILDVPREEVGSGKG